MQYVKLNIQLFAASGSATNSSLKSSAGNKGTLTASFTEAALTEENKKNNESTITAKASFKQVTGSYSGYAAPYLRLYWYDDNEHINGTQLINENVTAISKGETVTIDLTFDVKHKDDGTLNGYARAKWEYDGSGALPCKTGYATVTNTKLTTIPRAKTISALSADIGYDTLITIKQTSEDYTVTITYECGELSGTIEENTSETSIGWKIPNEIYTQLSSTDKEIDITLKATTFNGEDQIGSTQTTTLKARVNEEDNRPLAYLDVQDVNEITNALTDDPNKVVLNASSIKCNVQGMSKNGAIIQSMKINDIELIDFSYQQPDEGTPEDITEIALDEFTINKPTTNVFTLIVTDSRGFTNAITTNNQKTLEKIDYIIPTISATFKRNTPVDGLVNVRYDGKFFNGLFKEGTSNTLQMAYQYRDKESGSEDYSDWIALTPQISDTDNTYGGQLQLEEEFDYEKQFDFRLSVRDLVNDYGVVFTTGSIAKGKPSHWYDDENFYVEGDYYQRDKETGKWKKFKSGGELPVGSVYINKTNGTNPSTLLGYGEWKDISGLTLIGAGTYKDSAGTEQTFNAGDVVGVYTHRHNQSDHKHNRGTLTAAISLDGSYIYSRWDTTANANGTQTASWARNARKSVSGTNSNNTGNMTEGTPVYGQTGSVTATTYTSYTSTIQPSLVVYMWERIA